MSPSTDTIILQLYIEIDKLVEENKKLTDRLAKSEAEINRLTDLVADEKELWYQKAVKAEAEVERQDGALARQEESLLEAINDLKEAKDRLAKAQSFANELRDTPLDPYDDAFSDAPMRVSLRRMLGKHLKEVLK